MEKTIEEIRKAVLAYCDEVCPQGARHDVVANDVTIGWMGHGDTMDGGLRMYFFADWMYIDADMDDRTALLAYRLLGLDKRDALEAHTRKEAEFEARMNLMDAKQEKYMDLYRTEKEKSKRWESRAWKILQIVRRPSHRSRPKTAAVLRTLREVSEKNERLVEELTKIARLQHASYRSEVEAMKGIALNAIEAYKEGKKDE